MKRVTRVSFRHLRSKAEPYGDAYESNVVVGRIDDLLAEVPISAFAAQMIDPVWEVVPIDVSFL